jgi:hypothetical protein
MALANFFAKSALGAAQIIQGCTPASLATRLGSQVVAIAFDQEAAGSIEGRCALSLLVNLLSRFYPKLAIFGVGGSCKEVVKSLTNQALGINPDIEIQEGARDATVMVVVGRSRVSAPAVFYVGSDGWIAKFSSSNPVGCGRSRLAFGAGMSACIGAANIFRRIFHAELQADPDTDLAISLIDLIPNNPNASNPSTDSVDLGVTHLVGGGAIGNAATWALRNAAGISGELVIVDGERVELSNLQRYCLADQRSVGAFKVDLVAAALDGSEIKCVPHPRRWGDYLAETNRWVINRLAVAVDTGEDRCSVQVSLPETILNAWTQPGDFGISRHRSFGRDACLMCLYLPRQVEKSEDELIAEAIRLPERKLQIRQLLHTDEPVPDEVLNAIAAATQIPEKELQQFRGCTMRQFYSRAICGGLVMHLGGQVGPVPMPAHVPMAFQSAAAGILLAAEMVIDAGKLRGEPVAGSTRINLLKPLAGELNVPIAQDASGRCICADPDYLRAYGEKYPTQAR